ncbi:MAG: hypothetical protein CVU90_14475 [Firmicutes bacterium HGW-Firmicutes-15]|nr:MAG: hypothetical protein CVU90_14475 [Firmicutes bacterium HGW-Firmicutes-15]
MKVRSIKNLPILLEGSAELLGLVEKVVIGDDFKLAYLVINSYQSGLGIIFRDDFMLGEDSVLIWDIKSIKSYAHGEESSIYEKKIGDTVFDWEGKELGVLSDFIVSCDDKKVSGVELSSGVIKDILDGRSEIPLKQVRWASIASVMIEQEGSDIL